LWNVKRINTQIFSCIWVLHWQNIPSPELTNHDILLDGQLYRWNWVALHVLLSACKLHELCSSMSWMFLEFHGIVIHRVELHIIVTCNLIKWPYVGVCLGARLSHLQRFPHKAVSCLKKGNVRICIRHVTHLIIFSICKNNYRVGICMIHDSTYFVMLVGENNVLWFFSLWVYHWGGCLINSGGFVGFILYCWTSVLH
jgi:hypothetical protein